MASNLLAIYDAIKGMTVTVGATTPSAKDLDQLKANWESAELPVRLMLPLSAGDPSGSENANFIALGNPMRVDWRITDLCLWGKVGEGRGIVDAAQPLVQYAAAYVVALRGIRGLSLSNAAVLGASVTPQVLEWPAESGSWYYAVECIVTVKEILSD